MRSSRPKPLHLLCGRPMVAHVIDALAEVAAERVVVVVGHGGEQVSKALQELARPDLPIEFVEQRIQRGTGDAAAVGLTGLPPDLEDDDIDVIVLPGDTPLLRPATLAAMVRTHRESDAAATLLTAELDNPYGYGRVIRSRDGRVAQVVEESDADDDQRQIQEVCTSIYCFRRSVLAPALRRLSPENAQGEYYLTDVVGVLHDAGYNVVSLVASDAMDTAGVNDRAQLAVAEAELRDRNNERWMRRGVTMVDPERTYVDASVSLEADVTLFPGTVLEGHTVVSGHAVIGPDTRLRDCRVGAEAILEQVVATRASIGRGARLGPFVVLDAGAVVPEGAVVGPFSHVSSPPAESDPVPRPTGAP
jgi:bifunctional UDP-N-acetylglucosamine pyrophosphorylase/glucosamine-1-phosphate N-acetyltransferase